MTAPAPPETRRTCPHCGEWLCTTCGKPALQTPKCCHISCGADAEFVIYERGTDAEHRPADNFTHACTAHVGALLGMVGELTGLVSWVVSPIPSEVETPAPPQPETPDPPDPAWWEASTNAGRELVSHSGFRCEPLSSQVQAIYDAHAPLRALLGRAEKERDALRGHLKTLAARVRGMKRPVRPWYMNEADYYEALEAAASLIEQTQAAQPQTER